jgi:hypothetical protein
VRIANSVPNSGVSATKPPFRNDSGLGKSPDAWPSQVFAPGQVAVTARQVVEADAGVNREDAAVTRARTMIADCDRRILRYLDGLEAGVPRV